MDNTVDWIWDEKRKSICCFSMDNPVTASLAQLSKLERYEYENYDTYLIKDSNWSKIFVQEGSIVSIQCALHFIVNNVDLIGKTVEECEKLLDMEFFVHQAHEYTTDYMNREQTLKLILNSKNTIQYVIFSSLWK